MESYNLDEYLLSTMYLRAKPEINDKIPTLLPQNLVWDLSMVWEMVWRNIKPMPHNKIIQ